LEFQAFFPSLSSAEDGDQNRSGSPSRRVYGETAAQFRLSEPYYLTIDGRVTMRHERSVGLLSFPNRPRATGLRLNATPMAQGELFPLQRPMWKSLQAETHRDEYDTQQPK